MPASELPLFLVLGNCHPQRQLSVNCHCLSAGILSQYSKWGASQSPNKEPEGVMTAKPAIPHPYLCATAHTGLGQGSPIPSGALSMLAP